MRWRSVALTPVWSTSEFLSLLMMLYRFFFSSIVFIQAFFPKFYREDYNNMVRKQPVLNTSLETWSHAGWQGPWEVTSLPETGSALGLYYITQGFTLSGHETPRPQRPDLPGPRPHGWAVLVGKRLLLSISLSLCASAHAWLPATHHWTEL